MKISRGFLFQRRGNGFGFRSRDRQTSGLDLGNIRDVLCAAGVKRIHFRLLVAGSSRTP